LLKELDQGTISTPDKGIAFFPPSRAHETDLVMRLYGDKPIPDGFSLVDEMIRRIRDDRIDLRPKPQSGWYDYQTWALEPLVVPDRMPEAKHLELQESYRKQLTELFKGILALTRETHIKQLEIPAPGAAPAFGQKEQPVIITIAPELTAEPLATYYLRRAESYRFIRGVLDETFGAEALRRIYRLTAAGPVTANLATELDTMEGLFRGASATVARQLGLPPDAFATARPGRSSDADIATFQRWTPSLANDPDLGRDARMMVPLFFDRSRRKTKVWVFLGWTQRPLSVWFAKPPKAEVTKDGKKAQEGRVELKFVGHGDRLAYPVSAEVYVSDILDRTEFRRLCDRYKTRAAILEHLR
jgi:hypothetical protein